MPKFTSIPVTIEAVQFTNPLNILTVKSLAGENFRLTTKEQHKESDKSFGYSKDVIAEVFDSLHETWVGVKKDQWIIKGTKSELYPCDPEVFEEKYAPSGKSPSRK